MRLQVGSTAIELRFFNRFYLHLTAFDDVAEAFPSGLVLRTGHGVAVRCAERCRIDSEAQYRAGFDASKFLSASFNFFDVANSLVENYWLELDGERIWSFEAAEADIDLYQRSDVTPIYLLETGRRSLVLVFSDFGRLQGDLSQILLWQPDFFSRDFNNGVAISLVPLSKLASAKDQLLSQEGDVVLLVERSAFGEAARIGPDLLSRAQLVLWELESLVPLPSNGLVDTVLYFLDRERVASASTAVVLAQVLSVVTGYGDLFFPDVRNVFSYQGGQADDMVGRVLRSQVQGRSSADVVVVSRKDVGRLSDFDEATGAVFVNVSSLRFVLDAAPYSPAKFLRIALSRGAKVQIIRVAE